MPTLFAKTALLPEGWSENVEVEILANGKIGEVSHGGIQPPDAHSVDILLPAPVNAHSHAFQRAMAGLTERRGPNQGDSFWTWRELMYRFLDQLTPEDIESITAFVQMEMLESGYATNVEFHYLHHQPDGSPYADLAEMANRVAAAANETGIGLTLLPVHYQYGGCDKRDLGPGQRRFGNSFERFHQLYDSAVSAVASLDDDCKTGVAPHSLRAVAPEDLPRLKQLANSLPFHIHLAEQIPEVVEVMQTWGARPVEWFIANFDVDSTCCLIHCTQMEPHETTGLAKTGATAGLCPITESSLGDGIFDGVRWLENKGSMAIGSDSNIRISLSEEMRTLDYSQRLRDHSRAAMASDTESTGRRIFDCIVDGGAKAAGRETGRIQEGMLADLVTLNGSAVDLAGRKGDTILDCFVFAGDDNLISEVWSAGRHKVKKGKHVDHDIIRDRYIDTVLNLADRL
ncbi:MAG: formimidoylglutamate deiminase [Pseudomonadota bacterium]